MYAHISANLTRGMIVTGNDGHRYVISTVYRLGTPYFGTCWAWREDLGSNAMSRYSCNFFRTV